MKGKLQNSVWAIPDARIVLPARAVSAAGSAMTSVVVLLHLHDLGVGPIGIAALMACLAVPTIGAMGIAGRVADQFDSRRILLITAVIQAIVCLVLGGWLTPLVIYPAMIIVQLAQAFSQPTWTALVPQIVGEERIGAATSWQQGLSSVAVPIGTALGGMLYGLGQLSLAFFIDAATFAVLAVAAVVVRTRRGGASATTTESGRVRWSRGIAIVAADRMVWPLFVALLVFVVLVEGVNPAEIFLARDALGASPIEYGLSDAFTAVGAVVGSAIAARMLTDRRRLLLTVVGFAASAAALVAAGVSPSFWLYLVIMVGLTAGFGAGNASFGALLMIRTPEADRGKVYAALAGLARAGSMLALALGAGLLTWLGPRPTFVIAGTAGLIVMIIAGLRSGRAVDSEEVEPESEVTAR